MVKFGDLDKLDTKILYHLDVNARMPNQQIAKRLKVSREVVSYRIKCLVNKEVINRFYTHIQTNKLGYTAYKVYFKIKGMEEKQEKEFIDYFIKHDNVYWVARCDGIYDFIISITAKNIYELSSMIQEIFHKYDANFLSKDVTISVAVYLFRKEYLLEKTVKDIEPLIYGKMKGDIKLDEKDTEILKLLANNARMPVTDIANNIGVTTGAVIYRIKELEKKDIISAYRCSINLEKIGYIYYKVFLSLNFTDINKEKELHQFCLQNPNITLFLYCIGHWDFEMELEVESTQAFHNLLKEIKIRFSAIIKECESVIISKEYKFDLFPGCYPSNLFKPN